jgi:L-ascorbate metabolism protein UlaG (beta-lactamase superfamily)
MTIETEGAPRARASFDDAMAATLGPNQVLLWWLGQASFLLRGARRSVLVDPYLTPSDRRLSAPPFAPSEVHSVDAVAITHEHGDHLDRECVIELARRLPDASWIAPRPIVDQLTTLGVEQGRVAGAQPGDEIDLDGATLHAIEAHHGVQTADAYDGGRALSGGLVRYLGYVLDFGGPRVYHSGDTLVYEGLAGAVARLRPDVALLPINGRDFFRESAGLVGNMSAGEAAQLAARTGADVLVPIHYDMFANNLGFPAHLVDVVLRQFPELAVVLPTRQRPLLYGKV